MLPNTATDVPAQDASTAVASPEVVTFAQPYPDPPGYELREEIGKGGMGVVFRAADHIMNRDVAVKILQDRYAPDSTTADRFMDEAQITGQLQHPGIPAVYQVSKLADGRPFLAMKLIKGETLDALLKSNAPINRLAVLESICNALGYAHSRNVIHRDLKPANIMVGAFGEVQVMDWGLAKVLTDSREAKSCESPEPDDTTARSEIRTPRGSGGSSTQDGSVLGTPAYMPPEQAAGETAKVDQRSDVFGLGAILCVLLTGLPPYRGRDFMSIQLKAVRGQTEDAFARLDRCAAEPGVVALCKQCLSFQPADRPADANAVAQSIGDLRRDAEDRARQAELDRAKAEVFAAEQRKRRRMWLGLAAALLIGMFASSGLALWANHARSESEIARRNESSAKQLETDAREKAEQAQRDEAKAKREALEQTALATGVKDYLLKDLFELGNPARQQKEQADGFVKMDPNLKVRDLLVRAAQKIEGKFADQPFLEAEIRESLGLTLLGMGRADLAIPQFDRTRQLYTRHSGPDHPATLASLDNLASCYAAVGRNIDALKLREETLARYRQRLGPDHPQTIQSMNNLALSYAAVGRNNDALKLHEETLALVMRTLGSDHQQTLQSMSNLARSFDALGRHNDALKLNEETLLRYEQKLGPDHPYTLISRNNLASSYAALGRNDDALKLLEATLALRKQKLGPDHPDTLQSMTGLAISYAAVGRNNDAFKLFEETLAVRKQKLGPDHPDTLQSMNNLAISYATAGRNSDALKLYQETLAMQKQKLGPDHPDTLQCMYNLAISYSVAGRNNDALKLHEEALALRKQKLGPDHPDALKSMCAVVLCLVQAKRRDDASVMIREFLKLVPQAEAAGKRLDPSLVPMMVKYLLQIAVDRRDPAMMRDAAEVLERLKPTDAASLYNAACYRALTATFLKDKPEAKIEADKAMDWLKKAVASGWRDRAHIEKDTDLDTLRDRADFKELVASLPYIAPPPRAVRKNTQ